MLLYIVILELLILFQKYGKIDLVVSNAAVNPSVDPLLQIPEAILDKLWEINVKATVLLLQVNLLGEDKCRVLKEHICSTVAYMMHILL